MIAAKIPWICAHNSNPVSIPIGFLYYGQNKPWPLWLLTSKNYFNITTILIVILMFIGQVQKERHCFINWLIKIKLLTHVVAISISFFGALLFDIVPFLCPAFTIMVFLQILWFKCLGSDCHWVRVGFVGLFFFICSNNGRQIFKSL
jgi:hypothetical protein